MPPSQDRASRSSFGLASGFVTALAGLTAIAAVACGPREASVSPVKGPAGESGWFDIKCPHGRAQCQQMARDSCPSGYDVEDLRGDDGQNSSPASMEGHIGAPGNGEMVVSCKQ